MRSAVPAILLVATALAGCADRVSGSMLYMTPYKFEELSCTELKARAIGAEKKLKDSQDLRDRASASAAGPMINAVVYGPEYSRAAWEARLYQDQIARKCDLPPEPPPADQLPPPPR